MNNKQVITISPNGSLAGLQHKPKQGIDLRAFGKASICRASEVLWDDDKQGWYVEFREGAGKLLDGVQLTQFMLEQSEYPDYVYQSADAGQVYIFSEYEEAVQAEIHYLNKARLDGSII